MTSPTFSNDPATQSAVTSHLEDANATAQIAALPKIFVTQKDFNRSFLDLHDPLENVGYNTSQFDVSASFPLAREEVDKVVSDLYEATAYKVQYGTIPDAKVQLVDFNDVKTGMREQPRRYVVIERDTTRKTQTSIYATFLKYGDNLYVGVDSFILGPLDVNRLVINLVIGFAPLALLLISRSPALSCLFIPALIFAAWIFRGVILNLARGDSLGLALRKSYHKSINLGTFNVADILMFYQSVLPMILRCMIEVFKKHGIPTDVLEGYVQKINYVTTINNTEVNNTSGVMNIMNSAVGAANRVVSSVAPKS